MTAAKLKRADHCMLLHAAELLEQEAEALRMSHTLDGEWFVLDEIDRAAVAGYADFVNTASWLRGLARDVEDA